MAEKSVIASISQTEQRPFKTPQLPALRAVVTALTPERRQGFLLLYFQRVGSPSILGERVPAVVTDFRHTTPTGAANLLWLARMPPRPYSPDTVAHKGKRGGFL